MKFSSSGIEQRRQAVDDYEAQLNEANSRCERARVKYERVAKILVDATAGIDHLAEFLQPIKVCEHSAPAHTQHKHHVCAVRPSVSLTVRRPRRLHLVRRGMSRTRW